MTKQEIMEYKEKYAKLGYEFIAPHLALADRVRSSYRHNLGDLYDVYGRFSHAKLNVWRHWESKAREVGGYGIHVTSKNAQVFCLGFDFDDPDTGELMVAHITPAHNYVTCG